MSDIVLDFESTLQCTHNCMYCYNAWKNHGGVIPAELNTKDTIDMLETAFQEIHPKRFVFSGGEPFMRSDLRELIQFVHTKKIPINIISNGALLEEDDFCFCKQNGVELFEFTLLSSDKMIHNELTRTKSDFSAFDNVIWATQKALQYHFSVVHVFVATHKNLKTLPETLELSYALGVRTFLLNRFNPAGEGAKHLQELQITPLELTEGLKQAEKFAIKHPTFHISCAINIHPCLVNLLQFPHVKMTGCGIGLKQKLFTLDPIGNIRLCNFAASSIGNIRQQSFIQIMQSQLATDFISSHPSFCNGCDKLSTCQGGCKASADNCFGSPCQEDDWLQKFKKKSTHL